MTYRTAKVISPADMAEPLNGWYQNIPIAGGTAVGSYGGPTSVLANPGWRFFQLRGYVPVTNTTMSDQAPRKRSFDAIRAKAKRQDTSNIHALRRRAGDGSVSSAFNNGRLIINSDVNRSRDKDC